MIMNASPLTIKEISRKTATGDSLGVLLDG